MNTNSVVEYIKPNRKYFDKQIPEEDAEFPVSDETNKKCETLEKIFEKYFDYESISNAKVLNIV